MPAKAVVPRRGDSIARRRLLSDDFWAQHLAPPTDERTIVRYYTFGPDDLPPVATKRGDANRLGYALSRLHLRYPGRALDSSEAPPAPVLTYVARQLGIDAGLFAHYARRAATRRSHLADAMCDGGYATFDQVTARAAIDFLTMSAQLLVRPGQLAGILVEELRRRRVLLPPPLVRQAVIRGARQRAENLAYGVLTAGVDATVLARLEELLATQHLAGLNPRRRYAGFAAGAIAIEEALTDATLEMFEKLMASFGRTAKRKADERAARSMRDLRERRVHLPPGVTIDPILAPWVHGAVPTDGDHVARHWDELLRVATSIRSGTVTASAMLRKLSAYPRENGTAVALRENGRLERSILMLNRLRDIDLRRRSQAGFNKGEASNSLARAIFFRQLGELRDRTFENQAYRASGLNLAVAAVILCNTSHLDLAATDLGVTPETMRHVAPLGWEQLSLTGA